MKQRIITGVVAILIFIPIIIFSDTFVFPVAMAVLSAVGAYEMAKCITSKTKPSIVCAILSGIIPLLYLLENVRLTVPLYLLAGISLIAGLVNLKKKDANETVTLVFAVGYVMSAFALMTASRTLFEDKAFLMIFICSWVCDTAAYFTGRAFGKTKLAPVLSPKKTIEGAIGGTLFGGIAMVVYGLIVKYDTRTVIAFFFVGIVVAIFSQMGDLYASAYKRKYGIKDYGKLFPGHGGVMDRFDSVLGATVIFPLAMFLAYLRGFGF
ncbi:MAG: phosphatidate cytidylyltransferase [Clostridia bacterium]|nr:phosphatidate cytidylyltransferase [Clostridia bacterium]